MVMHVACVLCILHVILNPNFYFKASLISAIFTTTFANDVEDILDIFINMIYSVYQRVNMVTGFPSVLLFGVVGQRYWLRA